MPGIMLGAGYMAQNKTDTAPALLERTCYLIINIHVFCKYVKRYCKEPYDNLSEVSLNEAASVTGMRTSGMGKRGSNSQVQ